MKKVLCFLIAAALLLLAGCAAAEGGLASDNNSVNNSSDEVSDINDMPLVISFADKAELTRWFRNGGKWEEAAGYNGVKTVKSKVYESAAATGRLPWVEAANGFEVESRSVKSNSPCIVFSLGKTVADENGRTKHYGITVDALPLANEDPPLTLTEKIKKYSFTSAASDPESWAAGAKESAFYGKYGDFFVKAPEYDGGPSTVVFAYGGYLFKARVAVEPGLGAAEGLLLYTDVTEFSL